MTEDAPQAAPAAPPLDRLEFDRDATMLLSLALRRLRLSDEVKDPAMRALADVLQDTFDRDLLRRLKEPAQFSAPTETPTREEGRRYPRDNWAEGGFNPTITERRDVDRPALQAAAPPEGQCEICIEQGLLPSKAIACYAHSTLQIEELRADLQAAAPAPDGWRDIDSAPKEETLVLVCVREDCMGPSEAHVVPAYRHDGIWRLPMAFALADQQPTHWMALPLPPSAAPVDEKETER